MSILYVFLFISWCFRTFPAEKSTIEFINTTYYVLLGFWTIEMIIKIGAYYDKFFTKFVNLVVFTHYIGSFISLYLWKQDSV